MKTWEATRLEKVMENGRTKPLLVECERNGSIEDDDDEDGFQRAMFLIKSPGHPQVTEHTMFCELFGNLLARNFGIATPAPALV
jgi:hypothetical protein